MKQVRRTLLLACSHLVSLGLLGALSPLLAQGIQVTSANPPAAPQGTANLNVTITGSGFKKGAKSAFYLTGTTNTDGVLVNSTAFISSTQLTANITISSTATIANFDILVANTDGRTGKGTQLFAVTQQGTPIGCTTLGTPSGFTLVTTLNGTNPDGTPKYKQQLGSMIRVRPVTLTAGTQSRTVLVAAVASGFSGKLEIFVLDPATGQVLDGQVVIGTQVQPHITVVYDTTASIGLWALAAGDVNADGVPDFAGGNNSNNVAFAFVGSVNSNGILSYGPAIPVGPPTASAGNFGVSVAMGILDGGPGDVVAIGDSGSGIGHNAKPGRVFTYKFNGSSTSPGFNLLGELDDPTATSDSFGRSVAIADVTGDGAPDLIVGAIGATASNGATKAGEIYVFPAPLSSPSFFYTLSTGVKNDDLGIQSGAGHVNSSLFTDVIGLTDLSSADPEVSIFAGNILASSLSPTDKFTPFSKLSTTGWASGFDAGDVDGDGRADILVGVPNANNSTACNSYVGAAEVYFSNATNPAQPTLVVFQPPTIDANSSLYGWGVGAVPASTGNPPLLLVGERFRTVGGVTSAGQVYVYKKN